jgi:hypothetical protein
MYHYMKYSIVLYVVYFVYFMHIIQLCFVLHPSRGSFPNKGRINATFPPPFIILRFACRATVNLVTYDIRAVSGDCFWTT